MDSIFDLCVVFLLWLARVTGTTYKQINVIVFCVLWPLFTLGLMVLCWRQHRTIRRLRAQTPTVRS